MINFKIDNLWFLLCFIFFIGSISTANSQSRTKLSYGKAEEMGVNGNQLHAKVSEIVVEGIEAGAFPGAQVLIAKNGQIIYHEAFGFHTYGNQQEVQTYDVYDLASISKITTVLPAVMKLYDENNFDLDAPLKSFWRFFKKSNKADLTFREMLAHHGRLTPWIPYWKNTINTNGSFKKRTFKNKRSWFYPVHVTDELYLHRRYKKRQLYKAIKDSPLEEKRQYKYSGLPFYMLPHIIEKRIKMPLPEYLKQTFYDPIGANTLTYHPLRILPKEIIIPTEKDTFFRKIQLHGLVHDEGAAMMGGVSGNAGLFGNALDLAKLMQLYLNGGIYDGQRILKASTIQEFIRCQYCDQGNRRGLGFDKPLIEYHPQNSSTAKSASPNTFGHSGYTGTLVWVDPDEELIFIFLSNRVYPTRNNPKIYRLNIRPRIHQAIYDSFID